MWLDGRILPAERAHISVLDRGFLYGDALFETLRCYAGEPFAWQRHRRRLAASLRHFGIPEPHHDLRAALRLLLQRHGLGDAVVRITVSRGVGEGLLPPRQLRPTVLLSLRPIPSTLEEQQRCGIAAVTLPFHSGLSAVTQGHKTSAYLAAVQGRRHARVRGADDGIYVEPGNRVSEATAANLFVVRRGRLETAPLASHGLPGITRAIVLGLAARLGLRVRIGALRVDTLRAADEIFLTNSVIEILPVTRLDGRRVASGLPGPQTRLLQEAFRRLAERAARRTANNAASTRSTRTGESARKRRR